MFKALGDLVSATWDTAKAQWRKYKRDREIAKRKKEAEIQALKEAEEAKRREEEAKERAKIQQEAEIKLKAIDWASEHVNDPEFNGDWDAAHEAALEMFEKEANGEEEETEEEFDEEAYEEEIAMMEAEMIAMEAEAMAAEEQATATEQKKEEAKEALETVKKEESNRINKLWKDFKKSSWETLKNAKDGVLEIFQEIITAEKLDTTNVDKSIDEMAKNAEGSISKVFETVNKCLKKITELITALTTNIRDHKESLDDEEFEYEMDQWEEMMRNGDYPEYYEEIPPIMEDRRSDGLDFERFSYLKFARVF